MPERITNYVLQERPILPMVDLGLLQNSLATIHQGNEKVRQKQSELSTAIANMDLNPVEEPFRQNLIKGIETAVEKNSINGNAHFAIDAIIKEAGDVFSNPALLGRLKAQQEYKKFNETLDARVLKGDINQDTADWAKAMNPYHYKDKIDENTGKVIGGTDWKPGITPVKDIDFNDVFDAIAKELEPDSNQWDSPNAFVYKDGSTGNKFIPGQTIDYLSSSSGSYIRLTPEKIQQAIQNAFQNNPELAAQAKQAWKVLEWKADKGDITPENNKEVFTEDGSYNAQGGFFNKDGSRKSYEQYLIDMVDGYARTHQYNKKRSELKYNSSGISKMYEILKNNANNNGSDYNRTTGYSSYDGVYAGRYFTTLSNFSNDVGQYETVKAGVLNSLASIGIDLNKLPNSPEEFLNLRNTINSEEALRIFDSAYKIYKDNYDAFREEFEYVQNFRNEETAAWEGANDVLMALGQGRSLNEIAYSKNETTQEFIKNWSEIVDKTFGDRNIVSYEAKTKQAIDKIVNELGGENIAKDYGFVVSGNTISIDKDHSYLLYSLKKAIGDTPGRYTRKYNFNDDGDKLMFGALGNQNNVLYMTTNQVNRAINNFDKKLDALNDAITINEEKEDNIPIEVPFYIIDGANPAEIELRKIKEMVGEEAYARMYKEAVERFENNKNLDFTNTIIKIRKGAVGNAINIDDATKKEVVEAFKYSKAGNGTYQPYVAKVEGIGLLPGCRFTYVNPKDKDVKNYDIVIEDYSADSDMIRYNTMNPMIRNESSTIYNWNKNIPIYLGKSAYGEMYVNPIKESPNYQWVGSINGSQSKFVGTNNDVASLRNAYISLIMDRDKFVSAILSLETEEAQAKFVSDYVNKFIEENPKINALFNNHEDIYRYVMLNLKR